MRWYLLCFLLLFLQHPARADLWLHVDGSGAAHFAAEPPDARYQRLLRGQQFDASREPPADAQAPPHALPAAGARLLVFFDIAPDYLRIKHHVRAAAREHGVDYELLQALIATE